MAFAEHEHEFTRVCRVLTGSITFFCSQLRKATFFFLIGHRFFDDVTFSGCFGSLFCFRLWLVLLFFVFFHVSICFLASSPFEFSSQVRLWTQIGSLTVGFTSSFAFSFKRARAELLKRPI